MLYGEDNCCLSLGGFWEMEFINEDMCTPQRG